ncbi:MAG: GNA1162 family protein [Verrucomicrobiota bacterium]
MNRLPPIFMLGALAALFSGCVAPVSDPGYDYSAFRSADPRSILIVPVVNNTVDVDAADYFLSAISKPIAERGYYVFPVNMVKRVMEEDGLADANMVHSADPTRLAALFGADTVLYVSIERWDAQYAVIATTVTVEFNYVLRDGDTGIELWRTDQRFVYQSGGGANSGNGIADLIIMLVDAVVTKAKPNFLPLARQANAHAALETQHGLPSGPYRPKEYKLDMERF